MATFAQARAQWVLQNPRGSTGYDVSQADYDAIADDRAPFTLAQMNQQEAAAARALLVQQFVAGMEALRTDLTVVQNRINGNTALTAAELRVGLRDLLQAMIWIGDRIADGTIVIRS